MDPATLAVWSDALNVPNMAAMDSAAVASTFAAAADGVMLRLRKHVVADQGHLDEQMDRASGAQISAKDLTWSYAEALNAVHKRASYFKAVAKAEALALKEAMSVA
jgi:hypothetical protein